MTDGPVFDCAFEGFRVTRERPRAVALWAAAMFAADLGFLAGMVGLGMGPVIAAVKPFTATALTPDLVARVEGAGLWLPGLFALFLAANAVIFTALLRAVMEPQDGRFGYLRLGFQELRQVVLWLYALVVLAGVQGLIAAVQGGALAASSALGPEAGRLVLAAVGAAGFLAVFYPVVRLSIAPAMTFAERRVRLFAAWPLTRDRFWNLFGCYALAAFLTLAVLLLGAVAVAPLIAAAAALAGAGPDALQTLDTPDYATLAGFLTVVSLTSVAAHALLMTLALVILAAPGAVIYLALRGAETSRGRG